MESNYILEMKNIEKHFPGVYVLQDVSMRVRRGTVLALLGENGAGKSTLMKILLGAYHADSGSIIFDGKEIGNHSIRASLLMGISMVSQELSPILSMTIAENIFLNREPHLGKTHFVDDKKMIAETKALFEQLGVAQLDVTQKLETLSVAQMQLVEICKAVSYNSKLIILDEPTSSLAKNEIESLFSIMRKLKETGISFIFISHKLDEVFAVADDITILRDGVIVRDCLASAITEREVIEAMVGREITHIYPKADAQIGDPFFSVKHLSAHGAFQDISFDVRKGEVFGFAGLIGAGRTEVMETIFGFRQKSSGQIFINGHEIKIRRPKDAIRNGLVFVTEDRKSTGLFLPLDILNNMLIPDLGRFSSFSMLKEKKMKLEANSQIKAFSVRTPSYRQTVNELSGGNQQKVLLARWLRLQPDIVILDEPTRGIDVGAKAEIYTMIGNFAKAGKCVIVVSSELPEIMGICDRIAVMHEGTLVKIFDRDNFDRNEIMSCATGLQS